MSDIFKIFSIFTPKQLKKCYYIFFIMFVGGLFESIGIGAILPFITIMGQPNYLVENPNIASGVACLGIVEHTDFITATALLLIFLYLVKNVFIAWEIYIQRNFTKENQVLYSREMMAVYINKPYEFHMNMNTAQMLKNINNAGQYIFNGLIMPVFSLFTELITALAIWGMLVLIDAFTAIVVAGIMGLIICSIIRIFRKRIMQQGIIQNESMAKYIKWINQGLGGIKETKVLRKEQFFLTEFDESYKCFAQAVQRYSFLSDMPRLLIEGIVISGLLLLIVIKLLLGNTSMDIIPLLGVLSLAAFRLMPSASRIVGYYNAMKNIMPFFEEIYSDLIEIKERLLRKESFSSNIAKKRLPFCNVLEIKNLSFCYSKETDWIFEEVSFDIPRGKFVGIVGPSGAGKTTFIDIMLGLLKPSGGYIICDGIDINKDISTWQANLAYVPQDIYLIDGTVKENIALGVRMEDIDDNLIEKVLHMAELYDFVQTLPKGLDTFVGERGVKLSGGQRQRIGIARALYQEPNILILDEATSALDNDTEKSITDTILKLKGQITIIAIAHRVSTLEQCDFKVKFEDGRAEVVSNM